MFVFCMVEQVRGTSYISAVCVYRDRAVCPLNTGGDLGEHKRRRIACEYHDWTGRRGL